MTNQMKLLKALLKLGRPAVSSDIARTAGLFDSEASGILTSMKNKGWIQKKGEVEVERGISPYGGPKRRMMNLWALTKEGKRAAEDD